MTSWRSVWRSLRQSAGLPRVRFHDGRHTALTRLAEKGVGRLGDPLAVRARLAGWLSTAHIRRKALVEAASSRARGRTEPRAAERTATSHPFPRGYVTCDVTAGPAPKQHD